MKNNSIIRGTIILVAVALMAWTGCQKGLTETDAYAVLEKISLSFGNDRVFNGFNIANSGEKSLSYNVDEQIDWLEVSNPSGTLAGKSYAEVTCKVSRAGLPQNNYYGVLSVSTNTGNFELEVFMTVDMFLVTFINPVFSTIVLEIDTLEIQGNTGDYHRKIGKNDSTQIGFFTPPREISYYGQTSGRYTDSTQLGLMMEWRGSKLLEGMPVPRFFLDISKAYFHLSIINNFQVLNPLYVNAGSQYETIENIYIFQSSNALPIGYYHALGNTTIRAYVVGSSSTVTWSNGNQFTLPSTINQSIVIDNYSSDTITKKSMIVPQNGTLLPQGSREYGDVFEISGNAKN